VVAYQYYYEYVYVHSCKWGIDQPAGRFGRAFPIRGRGFTPLEAYGRARLKI